MFVSHKKSIVDLIEIFSCSYTECCTNVWLLKIIVTLRANLALKRQNFADGEIAIFDEACVYKRGEYWQFRLWLPKENKYARKSLRTRSETTAVERGKAAYLEIYANLQQGKTYFSITTKEGVQQYVDFRKRDVELGHIVSGRLATIATHLQHWLSFIGKDTKLKELERTDCENYFYHRQKSTNSNVKQVTVQNEQDDRDKR